MDKILMKIKIQEIADLVEGKITGNGNLEIERLARIDEAVENNLTFLYLSSYEKYFETTKASAILVKKGFKKTRDDITYIEVPSPEKSFFKLVRHYFYPEYPLSGIDGTSFVHSTTVLGNNVSLGKNVVISANCKIGDNVKIFHNTVLLENVEIGNGSIIFQNVSIREDCKIGKNVIIHPGTVIGSDGFGFNPDENGVYQKIPQIGNVIIEDDVEIGSNVSVDRAALGSTIIKRGVKIDNLVQIAHNVVVGEDTVISSQSGVSGSTKIGSHSILAGQVGLVGHIEIGDNVILLAQSGISKSILKPGKYFGSPAKELGVSLKLEAHFSNLPGYVDRIKELEKRINELSEELNSLKK